MSHNFAGTVWSVRKAADGTVRHNDAELAVLMDIRCELKQLNDLLRCPNFLEIPELLRGIRRAARRKPRKRRARKEAA